EDHAHRTVHRRQLVDSFAVDLQLAIGDVLEPRDQAQQGRLPAARRPDEHHELAIGDVQVDAAGDGHTLITLADITQRHAGHSCCSPYSRRSEWRRRTSSGSGKPASEAEPVCRQVYALTVENRRSGRRIERLDRCTEIEVPRAVAEVEQAHPGLIDRKSTRLNSSHVKISYAVFCLKKKNNKEIQVQNRQQ